MLVGCSSASSLEAPPTVTIEASQPAPDPEAPAPVASVPKRPKPAADTIGVPECDAYLTRFATCLSKMPPSAREAVKAAMAQTRRAYAQAAATPAGRAGLVPGCRTALDALAQNPFCR